MEKDYRAMKREKEPVPFVWLDLEGIDEW